MVLSTNSGSFPSNSHVSATFWFLLRFGESWNPTNCEKFNADGERGMAGTDPRKRGRSPVVLEVRFRSRAFSIAEIQSEIVLGYLHYLDFCTV